MTSITVTPRQAAETRLTREPFPEVPTLPPGSAASTAVISADGRYRYSLTRRWGSGSRAVFVGLNPSTADAEVDDPSTRRMIGFARAANCGRLSVVNLYAWRSTSPAVLRQVSDPVGADNDAFISRAVADADVVIAGWGTHPDRPQPGRAAAVLQLLGCTRVWCLGRTKDGCPRHPLYVASGTALQVLRPATHDWSEWSRMHDTGLPEPLRERICGACGVEDVDVDHHQVDIGREWLGWRS